MNPRYTAYARAHWRTPDEMLSHDREAWPGGCMCGFILWINSRKQAFYKDHPECMLDAHTIWDPVAWDAFLGVPP